MFDDRINHVIEKHLTDFGSEHEIMKVYDELPNVIRKPDFVYYNETTKGIEFYKKININVCVAIRIKPGKTLKVKSWYPANPGKIANRIKKINEGEHHDD